MSIKVPFLITPYLIALTFVLSASLLISISPISNRYIGNADLHMIGLAFAVFNNNYLLFGIFCFVCSMVFITTHCMGREKEMAMGFSLHFALCGVLLLQLNNVYFATT